jgi:hypothetical protein
VTRLITLITTSTATLDDMDPLSEKAMRTIESMQAQFGPEQWDLTVARDIGDFSLSDLHRMCAENAETEWVSFIHEGEVVKPDALRLLLPRLVDATPGTNAVAAEALLCWRRSYYLEGTDA